MVTRSYNGFPPAYRNRQQTLQTAAFKAGVMVRPTTCTMCARTVSQGATIQAHDENYHDLAAFTGLCFPCHMAVHRRFEDKTGWTRWLNAISAGWQPPCTRDYRLFSDIWHTVPRHPEPRNKTGWAWQLPPTEPNLYTPPTPTTTAPSLFDW